MNPLLNVDTKLFVDPLLFERSAHPEISQQAPARIRSHFEQVMQLLRASTQVGDAAWRSADKMMYFPELAATGLGYGAASTRGSGFGPKKRAKVLRTAKEIVDLGVNDPDLFLLIPLLEEKIGPDLISDMVTTIAIRELASFTVRVLKPLNVPRSNFKINDQDFPLPLNPFFKRPQPVILVPQDVLSRLPIATDWSEVADAAAQAASLRMKINAFIGNIWSAKVRNDKRRLRNTVVKNRNAVEALLETLHGGSSQSYDFRSDPCGLLTWKNVLVTIARQVPLAIPKQQQWDVNSVFEVVRKIAGHFRFLIEQKGLNKLLWHDGKPHHEEIAQRLFFAVASAYCVANNLDITPEADTGSGVVDFKFSAGFETRVLVEAKLSNNKKLIHGYTNQLQIYKDAEQTTRAVYLVIDVGRIGKKDKTLVELRNERTRKGGLASDLVFVDGLIHASASKR